MRGSEAQGPFPPRKKIFLYGQLSGSFSARAITRAARELESVLQPVLLAVADLERPDQAWPRPRLAILHAEDLTEYGNFIKSLLQAYCRPEERKEKDTFNRRVRNAVLLVVEAHRQKNGAIALALYCTVIEAVLTKKGGQGDISSTLSDHAATLLEPELQHRQEAVDFVKKLYDARSRVLHGESLGSEDDNIRNARCLVCALLQVVLDRREFLQRTGIPQNPDEFLTELRKSRFNQGHPMGAGPANVVRLWRKGTHQIKKPNAMGS